MLVIHPKDRTTRLLSLLYKDDETACVINTHRSSKEMGRLLSSTSSDERIMLLGHGDEKGLLYRKDDTKDAFDSVIVGHPHSYHLRQHRGNIIGIWRNAYKFARREGLHGLFTNLIITDKWEAQEHGIITLQMYIDDACYTMYSRLRKLLDDDAPLREIPQLMKEMYDSKDEYYWLNQINYKSFIYL